MRQRIVFPREVLLVEVERRCAWPTCNARVRVGLTKEEARTYKGFECERCERWHDDWLSEGDVPDWWEELMINSLDAASHSVKLREESDAGSSTASDGDGAAAAVARMSDAWRRRSEEAGRAEGSDVEEREDSL